MSNTPMAAELFSICSSCSQGISNVTKTPNKVYLNNINSICSGLNLVGGFLLFDTKEELVFFNNTGRKSLEYLLSKCPDKGTRKNIIPKEISAILKWMKDSRQCFIQQSWLMDFKIVSKPLNLFHIQARWVKNENETEDLLLLKIEDQNQFVRDIAIDEARQYGFTEREKEVWVLYRQNYTYKEMANTLGIKPNTVKKHMKSILAKQRSKSA